VPCLLIRQGSASIHLKANIASFIGLHSAILKYCLVLILSAAPAKAGVLSFSTTLYYKAKVGVAEKGKCKKK
jgi:hypothetical protein